MRCGAAALTAALAAAPLAAQLPDPGFRTAVRTGVVFESYTLGDGLAFDRISALVIPLSLTHRLGDRVVLDAATAYARASVNTLGGKLELSGPIDTDVRAVLELVPGRVIFTLAATLPTGQATVPDTTVPLYGVTATDLFGFMVPSLGGGGGISAGAATAFPLGRSWAGGIGATYRHNGKYVPVEGGGELLPGGEARLRLGLEGPLRGGAFLRTALLFGRSGRDEVDGTDASAIGDRLLATLALNLPLGRGAVSLYAWNMRRLHPRESETGVRVPAGNVFALGARLDRPLSPRIALAPSIELRHEVSGLDSLEVLGWLARPGIDLRLRLGERATLVTSTQYAFGQVRDEGRTVAVHGPRLAATIEWTP